VPEFLDLYIQDLTAKKTWINEAYSQPSSSSIAVYLRECFEKYWRFRELPKISSDEFRVLAVDSSSQHAIMPNGGIFYVARAFAISNAGVEFRNLHTGFDYSSDENYGAVIGRIMEWLEHKVVLEAISMGFKGFVLLDGSIYGRLAHVPLEINSAYNRYFMLRYFETLIRLFNMARENKVPIIGLSKESRSSFFREFLMRNMIFKLAGEYGLDASEVSTLISMALDGRRANAILDKTPPPLRDYIMEYISLKPDFLIIMSCTRKPGYSTPLILNAPPGVKKAFKLINVDPVKYLQLTHPISSRDVDFIEWASHIVKELPKLPAVISFYVLPSAQDTPMRVDAPAWVFNVEKNLSEVDFSEAVDADIDDILRLISAGYSGLEDYNVWLTTAHRRVKLGRRTFEHIYLPKFEEIVGRTATSRGYRRVRFP
jgi:hypothetical protein